MKKLVLVLVAATAFGVLPDVIPLPAGQVTELLSSTAHAYYGTSRRVARRTSRRTSARQNAYYHGGYAPYAGAGATVAAAAAIATLPVGVAYVSSLPPSCVEVVEGDVVYQRCGSSMYRPYMHGTEVVYVQE